MKLSLILEAIDRATGPARRATASIRQLTDRGVKPLDEALKRVDRTSTRFMGSMPARLGAITVKVRQLAGRAGMLALEKSSYAAGYAIGFTLRQIGKLALRVGSFGVAAVGAAGVGALGWLGAGVIGTGAKFEQLRVQLETSLKSAAAAERGLQFIKRFAEDTPYELEQVTRAFIAAKSEGIDPFSGALTTIGDAASGRGLDYVEAVKAVGDAQRGQWERLIEYGIKGSTKGAKASLTYINGEGRQVVRTVKNDVLDIQREVLAILKEMYGGGMARQSRTLVGLWSTIKDKLTNFQLDIADAGFFDYVKGKVEGLLESINAMARSGQLKAWAEAISKKMTEIAEKAWNFAEGIDWRAVANGLMDIANAAIKVATLIGKASDAFDRFKKKNALAHEQGEYDKLWNRAFDSEDDRVQRRQRIRRLNRELGRPENEGIEGEPLDRKPTRPKGAPAAAPTGKISLHITTDRGVSVKPTNVSVDRGLKVELNTGRTMASRVA